LYAPRYDEVHVMSLPDCRDIAKDAGGFCPKEFYVPDEAKAGPFAGRFGFVRGCYWACDSMIQYLDLSQIDRGIITRSDPFGFIDVPHHSTPLDECIELHAATNCLGVMVRCIQQLTLLQKGDALALEPG
jgi:hypothetical protein